MKKTLMFLLLIAICPLQAMTTTSLHKQRNLNNQLYRAISTGKLEIARSLIENGANVNAKDPRGVTQLHVAAATGSAPIAQLLIDNGAFINAQDELGRTPLHWASQYNNKAMTSLLIAHGASTIAKDREGRDFTDYERIVNNSFLINEATTDDETALINIRNGTITKSPIPTPAPQRRSPYSLTHGSESESDSIHQKRESEALDAIFKKTRYNEL